MVRRLPSAELQRHPPLGRDVAVKRYGGKNYVVPSLGWEHTREQKMRDQFYRLSTLPFERKVREIRRLSGMSRYIYN